MPIASFLHDGHARLGKVAGDRIIDLSVAAPDLPGDVIAFLEAGEAAREALRAVGEPADAVLPLADVKLLAPVTNPQKFLGIGMNYREHAAEAQQAGVETPPYQLWFNKQVSCIAGPYDEIELPRVSEQLDYEAELAVVIGRPCRHVAVEDARSVIGGYMVVNDVSVRDWQRRTPTHTLGKSFDTHGPIGPWLVLDDEIEDPHALELRMFVNGEQRQFGRTGEMIHNIFEQISYLSTVMTLMPGDILATGTPSGVGAASTPPRWLKAGDIARVEITGIGHIENRVVAEPA
jgi:2-keto-4-pentenoate hydratase/2-oxohepta-3-ene-1,7-dioic acid hydratase in catechol pathway